MKYYWTLLCIVLCNSIVKAQTSIDTSSCLYQSSFKPHIDTTYSICDTSNSNFKLVIENSPNNIWQRGVSNKISTGTYKDSLCALVTDTLNTYAANNFSAFYLVLPKRPNSPFSFGTNSHYYLKFWHKYNTDSLMDGCWLEFSSDSGTTWTKFNKGGWLPLGCGVAYNCNFYDGINPSWIFDTLQDGTPAWSGNSNGWRHAAIGLNILLPIKPGRNGCINAVRFVFRSDSIDNQKDGWVVQDISTGWLETPGGLSNLSNYQKIPIYPNPAADGVFTLDYPSSIKDGVIEIYNIEGRCIMKGALANTINLMNHSNGIYYYKISFDGTIFSGVLQKN